MRYWSEEERREVFQTYFDSKPAFCPACFHGVAFRMHYTVEVVALSVRCENCSNKAIMLFNGLIGLPAEKISHGV
jgi:hypothetical protein